jgi:hypothetical protein
MCSKIKIEKLPLLKKKRKKKMHFVEYELYGRGLGAARAELYGLNPNVLGVRGC